MFDTHAIARSLTDDHVTSEQFNTGLAELRADIYRAMLVQTGVTVGLLGLLLGFLRWLG